MDQAQPGSLLESGGQMGSSTFIENRKISQPPGTAPGASQHTGDTNEKEGGSNEDPYGSKYSMNNYGGLQEVPPRNQVEYKNISESSPELSGSNALSASRHYASSSLQDSPDSPEKGGQNEQELL